MKIRVAKEPKDVWTCDQRNDQYGISIPANLWEAVFKTPLATDPPLTAMVAKDDLIMASGLEEKFKVIKIVGPLTTSGSGINIDHELRPKHWAIVALPSHLVYPEKKDVRFFYDLMVVNGKIVNMFKLAKNRVYVVRRGKVGQIIDKYRRMSMGIVAQKDTDVLGDDELNRKHKIVIPPKRSLWLSTFRFTPKGQKKLNQLIRPGDIISVNTSTKRYRIVMIFGPITKIPGPKGIELRPPHFNLVVCGENVKNPKNADMITQMVAVDGRVLSLFKKNPKEVTLLQKGVASTIFDKYRR